ncbi:uncharacterized protein LOC110023467 isoform X1 [Phalaenopsis equestris]|uniref:uncharacterized protein LOC110023467 isoform X1 n=1 Tax=Phalaenopsis equestris TaxID=78828 RepID=UPI0009E3382B|nr:uncharacterized protein LOC110023467 isoform X1 [Phalaenopsis equestris]
MVPYPPRHLPQHLRPPHPIPSPDESNNDSPLHFKIHPWLFWKRKGTRRFDFNIALQPHTIYIAWNLTRARFPSAGSPEPSSGFFIVFSVDGEIVLVAGDMCDEAHRKIKAKQRSRTVLVSRREHVVLKGSDGRRMRAYRSSLRIAGADREIGIEIDGGMSVTLDGKKIIHVRRVRWKFRGSQWVEIGDGGGKILISWDLHSWFFPVRENPSPASAAIFVFCIESEEVENRVSCEKVMGIADGCGGLHREWVLGRNRNWSKCTGCGGGGGGVEMIKVRKKSLLKKCSSSSSFSSASSAASSSVVEWWSSEEAEMRGVDGFTLVVYAWKS